MGWGEAMGKKASVSLYSPGWPYNLPSVSHVLGWDDLTKRHRDVLRGLNEENTL